MRFSLLHSAPLYQNTKEDWFAGRGGEYKKGKNEETGGEEGEIKGEKGGQELMYIK